MDGLDFESVELKHTESLTDMARSREASTSKNLQQPKCIYRGSKGNRRYQENDFLFEKMINIISHLRHAEYG